VITPTTLKNIGLSDNESKVYLAMLELGPSSVAEIAKKAGINRPTAYFQIEALKKLGLVSTQTKGKKQLFIAEPPDQLEQVLNKEIGEIKIRKQEFERLLPSLMNLYRLSDSHPQVRFFEGKEGVLRMQEALLKSGAKEVFGITSLDDVLEAFPKHKEDYSSRRIQMGIKSKLIYTSSQGAVLKDSDKKMLRESRFIKKDRMPFTGDVGIYGNSVAFTALKGKLSGIIIDHPEIAESFRNFFKFLWEMGDK
jgi:sugar-specific transcriptional regulator TrmB